MYQIQCLWTAAREELDITFVILTNRGYQILHHELAALGGGAPGRNAQRLFDIVAPELDFVSLAKGHGVPGQRVSTADEMAQALEAAAQVSGPFLIEAVI